MVLKRLIRYFVVELLKNDAKFRMEIIKAIDPQRHQDLMYYDRVNKPPKLSDSIVWDKVTSSGFLARKPSLS